MSWTEALKSGKAYHRGNHKKPQVWLQCGFRGQEWEEMLLSSPKAQAEPRLGLTSGLLAQCSFYHILPASPSQTSICFICTHFRLEGAGLCKNEVFSSSPREDSDGN